MACPKIKFLVFYERGTRIGEPFDVAQKRIIKRRPLIIRGIKKEEIENTVADPSGMDMNGSREIDLAAVISD